MPGQDNQDVNTGAMANDKVAPQAGGAMIVDTVEELTPEWFTGVLRQGGAISSDVAVVKVRGEATEPSQVATVVRCELGYGEVAPEGVPASVIVKLPSTDEARHKAGRDMGLYEKEVRFYREIAPLTHMAVPHLYWGDVEPGGNRYTLVIEDLTDVAQPGNVLAKVTPQQAELAVGELVKLQAPLWGDPRLQTLPWLADQRPMRVLFNAVPAAAGPFLKAFGDRLEPAHIKLVERLAPKAPRWPAKAFVEPMALTHSDYRPDNMLFGIKPGAPALTVSDWQVCRPGPPALDLAILFGGYMDIADRRAHEPALLQGYHEGLLRAGVRDFTLEQVQESYRVGAFYPFLATIGLALVFARTDRDHEAWAQVLRGSAALIQDLDSDTFLD